jgi:hypothetical protein
MTRNNRTAACPGLAELNSGCLIMPGAPVAPKQARVNCRRQKREASRFKRHRMRCPASVAMAASGARQTRIRRARFTIIWTKYGIENCEYSLSPVRLAKRGMRYVYPAGAAPTFFSAIPSNRYACLWMHTMRATSTCPYRPENKDISRAERPHAMHQDLLRSAGHSSRTRRRLRFWRYHV